MNTGWQGESEGRVTEGERRDEDDSYLYPQIGQELNADAQDQVVYVTADSNTSNQQIDAFFSYASMTLSM